MTCLITNGRVVDPANGNDTVTDLLLVEGKVAALGPAARAASAPTVIDATGKLVLPGMVDLHVHLRQPGREDKETIGSGTRAAVAGGVTSVLAMPNTEPALDTVERVRALQGLIRTDALANVYLAGAITRNREGAQLVDVGALAAAGVRALSDDGSCVEDPAVLTAALREAAAAGVLLMQHCEDHGLSGRGVINEGFIATKLGLRGMPTAAEYTMVERNIERAAQTGCRVHLTHISCRESVELIRRAKSSGVRITADVTPHHLTLTDESCVDYDTHTKVNPPLRTAADVAALRQGVLDGTIDCIASDHAPHSKHDKEVEFEFAAFGMIGVQTLLSIAVETLVSPGLISWPRLVELLSCAPARLLDLPAKGHLGVGADADVVLVDPAGTWACTEETVLSKSKNTPFLGRVFPLSVTDVFVGGRHLLCRGVVAA